MHRRVFIVGYALLVVFFSPTVFRSSCLADEDTAPAAVADQEAVTDQSQVVETSDGVPLGRPESDALLAEESPLVIYDFGMSVSPSGSYGGYISLYADHRARQVGDTVTIIIAESSKASKSASTQTSKKSGSSSSLDDLFGVSGLPLKMGTDAASDYSGSGSTTRSGSMEATISATVKEVLPNGNLLLEGTRQIAVNDDVQTITVSGIVRPQAIGSDNSVLSTYLANAEIKYVGDGPTAQRPGIVTRILQTPFHWIAGIFRRIF